MKEKIIFADQKSGKNFQALIEPQPVCPDCQKGSFPDGFGPGRLKKNFVEASMTLQVFCGKCDRKLAEFPVTSAGE